MIIDFHTHLFPDALAPKALGKLGEAAPSRPCTDATVSGNLKKMDEAGVDLAVVCNIATNPRQTIKVNSFAIDVNDLCPRLCALGSLNPDCEHSVIEAELDRLIDHDIRGIKIHPEYSSYYIDAPEWDYIFSACEERGVFIVTHSGWDFISPDRLAVPQRLLAKMLDSHPHLTVVAAHLGGNKCWTDTYNYLCGRENLYLDTAIIGREGIDPELAIKIITSHGEDRVLFGSDMPWSKPEFELDFIRSLGLGEKALEKIFHENAEKLLQRV